MGLLAKLFNDASDTEFKLAQDLVAIAMADGIISEAERKVITEICQTVLMDEREQAIQRWMSDVSSGQLLLSGG